MYEDMENASCAHNDVEVETVYAQRWQVGEGFSKQEIQVLTSKGRQ